MLQEPSSGTREAEARGSHAARQLAHGCGSAIVRAIRHAQSREEILADKIIAVALRENRLKNRDLWDITWLTQQGVELPAHLIPLKIRDHKREAADFITLLEERLATLNTQPEIRAAFMTEMRRFLPAAIVRDTLEQDSYWGYLTRVVTELGRNAVAAL